MTISDEQLNQHIKRFGGGGEIYEDNLIIELCQELLDARAQLDNDQAEEREVMGCTKEELVEMRAQIAALKRMNENQAKLLHSYWVLYPDVDITTADTNKGTQ